MTTTALTHRNANLQAFGESQDMDLLISRMRLMLQSAKLKEWQLAPKFRAEAEANLNTALYRTAQLAIFYRLVPGRDIHIIPFGNDFVPDIGVESWKRAADKYCQIMGITYHFAPRPLTPEEVKKHRGADYDPADRGCLGMILRSDKEAIYARLEAMKYPPEQIYSVAYGFWRKKARKKGDAWESDPEPPAHRDRQWVAEKRAFKACLMREFSLEVLSAAGVEELRQNRQTLDMQTFQAYLGALPVARRPEPKREADGDILFDEDDTPQVRAHQPISETEAADAVTVDLVEEGEARDPADILSDPDLPDFMAGQITRWREMEQPGDERSKPAHHGILTGEIDALTGDLHFETLCALFGRLVNKEHRLSKTTTTKLLAALKTTRKKRLEGGGYGKEEETNPDYDPDQVDLIQDIGGWVVGNDEFAAWLKEQAA